MFTMRDFHKIKNGIKCLEPETYFCPKLNKLAYTLSRLDPYAIGQCGEKLMARRLRQNGYDVKRHGGTKSFDILLNDNIRCEVKTAKMFPKHTKKGSKSICVFSGVKPECFDILFMIFITPNGLVTKWSEQKHVKKYTQNLTRQDSGYYLYFDATCDNANMAYNDDIRDFFKFYPNSLKKVGTVGR